MNCGGGMAVAEPVPAASDDNCRAGIFRCLDSGVDDTEPIGTILTLTKGVCGLRNGDAVQGPGEISLDASRAGKRGVMPLAEADEFGSRSCNSLSWPCISRMPTCI